MIHVHPHRRSLTSPVIRAYPTGGEVFQNSYSWHGVLPYTTNGTLACTTADGSYAPLPSINRPTEKVYPLDPQDPKGWSYCYEDSVNEGASEGLGPTDFDYVSDDIFGQVIHGCLGQYTGTSPVQVVPIASFLLDETTSYIDTPISTKPEDQSSQFTETLQTRPSFLVDPLQTSSLGSDSIDSSGTSLTVEANGSLVSTPATAGPSNTSAMATHRVSTQHSPPSGVTTETASQPGPSLSTSSAGETPTENGSGPLIVNHIIAVLCCVGLVACSL